MVNHDNDVQWLDVHHSAKAVERAAMVDRLRLPDGARLLDVGSGAGVWVEEFKSRATDVEVVALDVDVALLRQNPGMPILADCSAVPCRAGTFDVVWCANVLMYARDPIGVIRELARCLRLGGRLILKEEDSGRDILMPWPEWLDVEVRKAWLEIVSNETARGRDSYLGRSILAYLSVAGLQVEDVQTSAMDRVFPFDLAVVEYVSRAFLDYDIQYASRLSSTAYKAMVLALNPTSPQSIWSQPHAHIVFLETIVVAKMPI